MEEQNDILIVPGPFITWKFQIRQWDVPVHIFFLFLINGCSLCFTTLRSVCFRGWYFAPILMLLGKRFQIQLSAWLKKNKMQRLEAEVWKEMSKMCGEFSHGPRKNMPEFTFTFEFFQSGAVSFTQDAFLLSSTSKRQKIFEREPKSCFSKPQKCPSWAQISHHTEPQHFEAKS